MQTLKMLRTDRLVPNKGLVKIQVLHSACRLGARKPLLLPPHLYRVVSKRGHLAEIVSRIFSLGVTYVPGAPRELLEGVCKQSPGQHLLDDPRLSSCVADDYAPILCY